MDFDTTERRPPGTVTIEDLAWDKLILQPRPSEDPEQPLNWSATRKAVNFAIVCFYALMTFVLLDIGTVIWAPQNTQLGISYENLTNSFAANCAGLAVGCILLIPIAIICGRRPLYIVSTLIQLASAIWQAKMWTTGDLMGSNVLSGIAGAVSESIVQMTISDMFFVHQRATMNAVYLVMTGIGSFLAPVAAGYSASAQGWRWIWWWTTIFLAVVLVVMIFFYEETKFSPRTAVIRIRSIEESEVQYPNGNEDPDEKVMEQQVESPSPPEYPKKSLRERFSLLTLTPGGSPSYFELIWGFVYLLRFPTVAYTALMYGTSLAWFSVILTTLSTYFTLPPYNFSPSGIGLLNLPPFIGSMVALVISASNDWIILQLAKRNNGVYEPEMRLWLALPGVILGPAGMLLFGLSMANGYAWIIPSIGSAIFGFGLNLIADTSLTYLQDCYYEVVGNALVPIAFVRNGMATMIVFVLTPWINRLGLYNMFICAAGLAWAGYLTTVPMMIWGKYWRVRTAAQYEQVLRKNKE